MKDMTYLNSQIFHWLSEWLKRENTGKHLNMWKIQKHGPKIWEPENRMTRIRDFRIISQHIAMKN